MQRGKILAVEIIVFFVTILAGLDRMALTIP